MRGMMYELCSQRWSQVTGQVRGRKEEERHSLKVFKQARGRALLKALSRFCKMCCLALQYM